MVGQHFEPGTTISIQYSASSAGPWKLLGTLRMNNQGGGVCPVNAGFYSNLRIKLANAYYRASFAATPDYQATVSKSVHLWKYLTRMTSVSVSPTSVAKGGNITVKGKLQQYAGGKWRAYGGRRVLIVLRPAGHKKWYWIEKVTTSASGAFSKTFADPVSASWTAAYEGDATHFVCSGSIHAVRVTIGVRSPWRGTAIPWRHPVRVLTAP